MVKVISLSNEAYLLLKAFKQPDMSFSDTIISKFKNEPSQKTEDTEDLVSWIESKKSHGKKEPLHSKIDSLLYEAKK
ncbi:MAG: antitoxin VapB family protein [Candidatus Micrarchaeia archaeon]